MRQLKGIFLSLLAVSPMAISLSVVSVNSANAQAASQTLAECVRELNDAYPYNVGSDVFKRHTQDCLNNLVTQTPTESLGQCVAAMNRIYPYNVGSDVMAVHTEACNELLTAQKSNSNRQVQPTPNGTIFVVPGASSTSNQSNQAPKATAQQIADCVKDLMFDQEYVCTDPDGKCGVFSSYWRQQNVATGLSEDAAVRACTAGGR